MSVKKTRRAGGLFTEENARPAKLKTLRFGKVGLRGFADQEREGKLEKINFFNDFAGEKAREVKSPREQLAPLRNKIGVANRGTAFLMRINR